MILCYGTEWTKNFNCCTCNWIKIWLFASDTGFGSSSPQDDISFLKKKDQPADLSLIQMQKGRSFLTENKKEMQLIDYLQYMMSRFLPRPGEIMPRKQCRISIWRTEPNRRLHSSDGNFPNIRDGRKREKLGLWRKFAGRLRLNQAEADSIHKPCTSFAHFKLAATQKNMKHAMLHQW